MTDQDATLKNPTLSEAYSAEAGSEPVTVQTARDQLALDIGSSGKLQDAVQDLRFKVARRELELELMPFWKNLAPPFALTTSITVVLITAVSGIAMFGRIPPHIPFYYNAADNRWEQADKVLILFTPIVIGGIDVILLRLIYAIFPFDDRLSLMLSWCLALINLLIILALTQIYQLIL